MRGSQSINEFAEAMLATLNQPKNAAKGPWDQMPLWERYHILKRERAEVDEEIECRIVSEKFDWERLAAELVDEAICAMIMWELCQRKIVEG